MPRLPRKSRPTLAVLLVTALLATASPALADTDPQLPDPLDAITQPDGEKPPKPREKVDKTFKVATFNILGSQHTSGGDYDRTVRTARMIRRNDVALAGLQEVQQDQHRWLKDELPRYRIWPGMRYDAQGIRLQIAWERKRFTLLDHGTVTTTFSYQQRPIPWVRLKDEQTGRKLSVIDIHNSPSGQEADRDSATRREIELYRNLRDRGPVVIVGDANERGEWFCKLSGGTDARAANGGSHSGGSCRPPRPTYVDWVMGGGHFEWKHYRAAENPNSDHLFHTAVLRWGRD